MTVETAEAVQARVAREALARYQAYKDDAGARLDAVTAGDLALCAKWLLGILADNSGES